MNFFKLWGNFMMEGARAHAQWEIQMSANILGSRKRVATLLMLLVPIILGGIVFAEQMGSAIPDILGGKKAYSPAFYSTGIFIVSILIGLGAGLITGCIGAGGGFIIAPALMSAGIKGILAVGTDLFHIFAKAIMGSIIHRKLGNVSVPLAAVFLIGAISKKSIISSTVCRCLISSLSAQPKYSAPVTKFCFISTCRAAMILSWVLSPV